MSGLTAEEHSAIQDLSERVETGDYYAILGVAPTCSAAELKKAYYDLSRRFHPDRFYRRDIDELRDTLEEVFTGINISFEVLSDEVRRRRFDLEQAKKVEGGDNLSERRNRPGSRSGRTQQRRVSEQGVGQESAVSQAASMADPPVGSGKPSSGSTEGRTDSVGASSVTGEEVPNEPESIEADSGPQKMTDPAGQDPPERRMSTYARHRARMRKSRERAKASGTSERRSRRSTSSETVSSADSPRRASSKVTEAVRGRINARLEKAKACFEDGQTAMEEENWVKAASSFYMAHQYNPKNAEYKALWEETQVKSNQTRAAQFIALAENAESFRNVREAMENYKKAAECDPQEGTAHYRFGQLLNEFSGDARSAMQQFRLAVQKEPDNVRYRMALAQLYLSQNMNKNAVREYQKVVELDPKNKDAKSALRKLRF